MTTRNPSTDQILLLVPMDKAWSKEAREAAIAARRANRGAVQESANEYKHNVDASQGPTGRAPAPKNRKEAKNLSDEDVKHYAKEEAALMKYPYDGGTSGRGHASTEYRSREKVWAEKEATEFLSKMSPEAKEAFTKEYWNRVEAAEKRQWDAIEKKKASGDPKWAANYPSRGQAAYAIMMQMLTREKKLSKRAASKVGSALGLTDMMFSG